MNSMIGMTEEPRNMTIRHIYKDSGIRYMRYVGEVDTKPHGQHNIGGSRPAFSKMNEKVADLRVVVVFIVY